MHRIVLDYGQVSRYLAVVASKYPISAPPVALHRVAGVAILGAAWEPQSDTRPDPVADVVRAFHADRSGPEYTERLHGAISTLIAGVRRAH